MKKKKSPPTPQIMSEAMHLYIYKQIEEQNIICRGCSCDDFVILEPCDSNRELYGLTHCKDVVAYLLCVMCDLVNNSVLYSDNEEKPDDKRT